MRTIITLSALLFVFVLASCSDDPDPTDVNQVDFPDAGFEDAEPDVSDDTDLPDPPDTSFPEEDADRPDPDSGQDFEWDDDFELIAVSPARGPVAGGTTVFFSGGGLTEETTILFDGQPVPVAIAQGQLTAVTPPASGPGPVTVRAVAPDGETSTLVNGYTYSDGLEVTEILPARVPTTGGVEITLQGKGFMEPMGVSFAGTGARRIDVVNSETARVVVPQRPRGHADLRVSIPDESVLLPDALYFFEPLEISHVDPALGSTDGGDTVTIHAQGLTWNTIAFIDDVPAPVQNLNVGTQEITVLTPPATGPGVVDVLLENADDAFRLRDGFVYDDGTGDALFLVSPATAPTTGGSEHLIAGRGLDASDATLQVGGQTVPLVDADATGAYFEAPAHAAGPVDIALLRGGTEVALLTDALTYVARPIISDVSPTSGPADGGDTVVITGTGFDGTTSATFGGLPASFQVISDTEIHVTAPRSEPGPVDITVHNGPESDTLEQAYRFDADLHVWSMRPARGALAGGTLVHLQGSHFEGLIEVEVGGNDATDVRRIDPYTVSFRTPQASSPGPRDVELKALGQEAEPPYPFVYFNPASSSGGASGAPVDGAVNVTVVTPDGLPIPGAFVMLSTRADTPYQGFTNALGQVTLSGTDVLGAQTVTATAPEFSAFTAQHLNAENLTIILSPLEGEGGGGQGTPPPIAQVSGTITISGKSDDPGGGEEMNMSIVRTTRTHFTGPVMNPGVNATVAGEGQYSINTRVGDLALVALCGIYDEATDTFEPRFMAVERFLFLSNGDHKNVDLDCDIRLDQTLPIKLVDPVFAPTGPTINEIRTYLDFGFEGVFRFPDAVTGLSDILVAERLPSLTEPLLQDLSFAVIAGSYTGTGVPYTQTTLEGVTTTNSIQATAPLLAVPELINPSPGGVADGEIRLGKKGVHRPDVYYVILRNGMGLPVWTFVVPGHESVIPLPEFPSFSGLPPEATPEPYQPGTLFAVSYGMRIPGFRYNGFTLQDFNPARWSSFSVSTWQIRLTD